jgi:hypothetical protein
MVKLLPGDAVGLAAEGHRRRWNAMSRRSRIQFLGRVKIEEDASDDHQGDQDQENCEKTAATAAACSSTLRSHASVCVIKNSSALLTMDDIATQFGPVDQGRRVFHMATHTKFVLDRDNGISSFGGKEARVTE